MATAKIQVLSDGPMRGNSFDLTQNSYSIGRSESCDICIPDGTISGHHCTVFRETEDSGYFLRDEGSTNGTRSNSQKVEEGQVVQLNNGDIFQLGGIELLYDSGDGAKMELPRPTRVINLDDNHTENLTTTLQNMGLNAGGRKKAMMRESHVQKALFKIILGVLACLVLYGIFSFVMSILH